MSGCLKSDAQWLVISGTDERPSARCRAFQLYYNFFELNIFDHIENKRQRHSLGGPCEPSVCACRKKKPRKRKKKSKERKEGKKEDQCT